MLLIKCNLHWPCCIPLIVHVLSTKKVDTWRMMQQRQLECKPPIIRLTSSHTPSIIHTMLCQHTHGIAWQPAVIIFTCCTSVTGKKKLQTQHKAWQMLWKAGLLLINGYNSFQTVHNSELRRTPWCHKSEMLGIKSISSNDRPHMLEALFLVIGMFIYIYIYILYIHSEVQTSKTTLKTWDFCHLNLEVKRYFSDLESLIMSCIYWSWCFLGHFQIIK